MNPVALDVCLNGDRNYVQAVQMIGGAARHLAADAPGSPVMLQAFAFRRITQSNVGIVLDDGIVTKSDSAAFGDADFTAGDRGVRVRFIELAGAAPRRAISETVRYRLVHGGEALSGRFAFEDVRTFDNLLVVMTQTVKLLHDRLGPTVRDIWLTGMRNGRFPVGRCWGGRGEIDVHSMRVQAGERKQSLSAIRIAFDDDGDEALTAAVTFAFRE